MSTAALLALAVVGLSGCMKVDADLTLQSDDTIDGTMLMAYTNEMAITLDVTPDSVIETMQFAPEDTSPGETVTVEPYEDDAYMGGTLIFDGSPLDRFADEESGTPGLTITREGDEFVVSGTIDLTEETNGDFEETYGTLLDGYDAQVSITFPGPVTEHTGDLSGNTVTWEPQIGESLDVSARGSAVPVATSDDQSDGSGTQGDSTTNEDASEGLSTPLMIGIGAGALLLIGLVLFLILHSRKSGQTGGYPGQGYGYPGQEYAPQGQGYAGPPQGYAPPQQGYAPPQQSYAPPPQQAPPQGYVPPPAPPQGYGYPAQPPHQGGWPPQGPPGGPPLR